MPAIAEEADAPFWTDTIRSKSGQFAVHIDAIHRTALVIRSDERDGLSPRLRLRIVLKGQPDLLVPLEFQDRADAPLRYQAKLPSSWAGKLDRFLLESGSDAQGWKALEPAKSR